MKGRTAYLISCSDHYNHRLGVMNSYLQSHGYETTYVTSDFDHTTKKPFVCKVPGCVQIPAKPYQKNLSVHRILSHRSFARDVFRFLENQAEQPDVIVVLIPPNFLAHYAAKYKKHHPNVKLVFDVFDLWPETFPFGKLKKLLAPAFRIWAWIRDHSLGAADFVITECEMFREKLNLPEETSATVYLCAEPLTLPEAPVNLSADKLDLCYLGAINNVIGISEICELIERLTQQKPVTLHVIGKGEREQEFIDSAKAAGADVIFYGPIYDDRKKQEIINQCHFGLNIMKPSVCVGLTMKSIDYFRFGLPIINNIPADTQKMVEEKHLGIQLKTDFGERFFSLTFEDFVWMRKNVEDAFIKCFSEQVIVEQYQRLLDKIV